MKNEPTTTELMDAIVDLHQAVGSGFRHVEKRFDRLEARMTSMEGEMKRVHHWMAHSDARFDALERRTGR